MMRPGLILLFFLATFSVNASAQSVNTVRPYSTYKVSNGVVYASGQVGISATTGKLVTTSFEAEVNEVMQNISRLLKESGSDFSSVINVVVYLKDINRYAEFNKVYTKYFNAPYPARTCIAVADLPLGASVEIAVTAEQKKHSN
ncbi:Rid family detoxifying hydrolase [Mucilaginibacter kameinonensis]|uniref:Rid family detoxifying hydrolase n=1 Tax=Mucilaginibacter kameinonensis TaxID=452286 RepID=UPI0013CED4AE|nr:Rid family detoxifying hydrolase [Mucilaginibacter kameinonensis]